MAICCVCIFLVLMCAFFVDESHAAQVATGKTSKKEQTVKMKLGQGTALITVKDADSWVFAQIQDSGNDTMGTAVNGDTLLTTIGQKQSFTVQVKTAGTYYLYLHGENAGASYTVQHFAPGGTLKSGVPMTGTSFADDETVSFYRINIPRNGSLRISAKDAGCRYYGYSKIRLKKGDKIVSGEEHLISGLDYTTTYGVSKGTYYIGVRSSSELYKLTAKFKSVKIAKFSTERGKAANIARKSAASGVIEPGDATVRWYKAVLPAKSKKSSKRKITLSAVNNNVDFAANISVDLYYKTRSGKKYVNAHEKYLLNNSTTALDFGTWKKKKRKVLLRIAAEGNISGAYTVTWK